MDRHELSREQGGPAGSSGDLLQGISRTCRKIGLGQRHLRVSEDRRQQAVDVAAYGSGLGVRSLAGQPEAIDRAWRPILGWLWLS